MNIEKLKDLCLEHDRLKEIILIIDSAIKDNYWVKIKSPRGEAYMSDIQIKSVYDLAKNRILEIEKEVRKIEQCACSKYGKSLNSGIKCSSCGREL